MYKLFLIITFILFWILITVFLYDFYDNYTLRNKNINIVKKLEKNSLIKDSLFLEIKKYYINLDRSENRNKKITKQFEKYNIKNYHRVEAYDVKKLDSYDYINEYKSFFAGNYVELAVCMSHIKAIETSYQNGDEYALIMEDDINFCTVPYWNIKLENLLKKLNEDCDILLLANNSFLEGEIEILKAQSSYGIATGVCYLITKKGMEKLHSNFISKEGKIQFLEKHNLGQQPFVFDRGFLNFFNLYYTSQSLFIPEDFGQDTLVQRNLINRSQISDKVIQHYSKLI